MFNMYKSYYCLFPTCVTEGYFVLWLVYDHLVKSYDNVINSLNVINDEYVAKWQMMYCFIGRLQSTKKST